MESKNSINTDTEMQIWNSSTRSKVLFFMLTEVPQILNMKAVPIGWPWGTQVHYIHRELCQH